MAKTKDVAEQNIELIEESLSKTEAFVEDNQQTLIYVVVGILAVVSLILGYQKFYIAPLEEEATSQMFAAEQYFAVDSFNLALNGDGGNYPGFLDIIDEYGSTKSGNLACYYAGISSLNLGNYEDAIEYLEDFSSDDKMVSPVAKGAIGDANMELGEVEEAISHYLAAAEDNANEFTSPIYLMKAGKAYESINDYANALSTYEQLKAEFPKSSEARLVDKYIVKAKSLSAK